MITIIKATPDETAILADTGKKSFIESHGNSAPAADIESYISRTFAFNTVKEELCNPENIFHILYYKDRPAGYSKIIFNIPNGNIDAENITGLKEYTC